MKRITLVLASVLLLATCLFAANPTVTVTKTTTARAFIYNISYTTSADTSTVDTAYVFNENGNWFSIDGFGEWPNKNITLECFSNEATSDSIQHTIYWQVSSKASPTVTAGVSPTLDWITAETNTGTLDSTATGGASVGVAKFTKIGVVGQATKMRILVAESGGVACSKQTITLRLVIPRK